MKYKLGQLVTQYDEINQKGEFDSLEHLQGINSLKFFQECKSNKNDIDLNRYRICRKGMFAYNRATSRNGERISIAYRTGEDCLISPSYYCFSINDENTLLPEYLDIWFKRPVFDKYARFNSWGSATEFFTFEDFCETEIDLPPIEEQRKIVHDYKVITDRIELLKKINENLEEQANSYIKKSIEENGYCDIASNMIVLFDSQRKPISGEERANVEKIYPYYGAAALMDYIDEYIFDGIYGLLGEDGTVMDEKGFPIMQYVWGKFWVNNHAHIFQGCNGFSTELAYLILKHTSIKNIVTGAVQLKVNQENLKSLKINMPNKNSLDEIDNFIQPIFAMIRNNCDEINRLKTILSLLLSNLGMEV